MRNHRAFVLISLVAVLGCGDAPAPESESADTAPSHAEMPDDDVHAQAMSSTMGDTMHQSPGINAEITLDPAIADDWRAIRVKVVEPATSSETVHEVVIGEQAALGDTGLGLRVVTFIPDFVMGEDGITSRSADPLNPAARVIITEQGKDDFEGWLFGAMPEIHAFPHDRYQVLLVEGVPAK
jgi:hypothetical protein